MEDELILVKPSMEYKNQAMNFVDEVEKVDLDENIRFSGMNRLEQYKDWIVNTFLYNFYKDTFKF